jgi:hypothetical protein
MAQPGQSNDLVGKSEKGEFSKLFQQPIGTRGRQIELRVSRMETLRIITPAGAKDE